MKKQKMAMIILLLAVWGFPLTGWTSTSTTLHSFTGGTDGAIPNGDLILSGTKLYGMTSGGGNTNGDGVAFSLDPSNNSRFTAIHTFNGSDGAWPEGSFTLSGTKLYGMTSGGGDTHNDGAVFSIDLSNNNQYANIYSFNGTSGADPMGSLILIGNKLYGTSSEYFTGGNGTIFSIDLSKNNQYAALHTFSGSDGANPFGSLILAGNKLYGMTSNGGSYGNGGVFSIDPSNNNQYSTVHSFTGTSTDGATPNGSLIFSGTKLFGMTEYGGGKNRGVIFSIDLGNNNQYAMLHSFTESGSDGAYPYGSLTLSEDGTLLYGMTCYGGNSNAGVIFSIGTDGSSFSTLYSFSGSTDGANPYGSLTLSADGTLLYGMTYGGGESNMGVIFSFPLSASTSTGCTAVLNKSLGLHIPYITYPVPLLGTISLSADFTYVANPSLIVFEYIDAEDISNPSFSCTAATLSTSLLLHIPDVLLSDGITHVWADLTYNAALSTNGNVYFAVSNYGYL